MRKFFFQVVINTQPQFSLSSPVRATFYLPNRFGVYKILKDRDIIAVSGLEVHYIRRLLRNANIPLKEITVLNDFNDYFDDSFS